jgi:hypothetical protein
MGLEGLWLDRLVSVWIREGGDDESGLKRCVSRIVWAVGEFLFYSSVFLNTNFCFLHI